MVLEPWYRFVSTGRVGGKSQNSETNNVFASLACNLEKSGKRLGKQPRCKTTQLAPLGARNHAIVSVCRQTDHVCLASPIARSPRSHLNDSPRLRSTLDYLFGRKDSRASVLRLVLFFACSVRIGRALVGCCGVKCDSRDARALRVSSISLACAIQNGVPDA